ncbi:MAG: SLC13/DASS family transporter [Sphingomonadales bacterium]|nr:SLC13/DASS family transporter [Sphingomonadales bacterium]
MSHAQISGLILALSLAMFVSEKVRHDLVAVIALIACIVTGLVPPAKALIGFSDPAVIAVAAVLVVGRTLELSGGAGAVADRLMPRGAPFGVRMPILLVIGAVLSAFMNNIAALVVTMPIATRIASDSRLSPGAILMPLSFATILGGMTTLIGTPANLIISSVRERLLGQGFSFFAMTPVGLLACVLGITYVSVIGWRMLPSRRKAARAARDPWLTYELRIDQGVSLPRDALQAVLRKHRARLIGIVRGNQIVGWPENDALLHDDRLLVIGRTDPILIEAELPFLTDDSRSASFSHVLQVSVAHGSRLIGRFYEDLTLLTSGLLRVVAAGPRAARMRRPLRQMRIAAGDQLFLEGRAEDLAQYAAQLRLLEVDHYERANVRRARAWSVAVVFLAAIVAIVAFSIPAWLAFFVAAAIYAATGLIPSKEIYSSIDWSVIVLLAAMIPVGSSFESSGASDYVANWLGSTLAGQSLFVTIAAMCLVTMLLSIFLNNVATALVMAPLGVEVAKLLHAPPDALLLAVLIGASSDFLTPIGHQNNLLVMAPGGYRFSDYSRMGAMMTVIVVLGTATYLSHVFGR